MGEGYSGGFAQHTERPAPPANFRDVVDFEILRDFKKMKSLLKDAKYLAFDTETTGLDPSRERLVGFSFATGMENGYYVPIAHQTGENASRKLLRYLAHIIKSGRPILAYNKNFDLNILEISEGLELGNCLNVFDVQALVWLRDTDITMPSLKDATQHFLGWTQPKFAETVGESETFDLITPEDAVVYAGLDAVATLGLFEDTIYSHPYLKKIFKVDNVSLEALRQLEHPEHNINALWLDEEFARCSGVIQGLRSEIFQMAGKEFNPNSRPQTAQVLLSLGVPLKDKTPTGQYKVSLDTLDVFDHPICQKLAKYSQEIKYLGSYVKPLMENVRGEDPVRFRYLGCKAPTGRLACGGEKNKKGKRNTYYSGINLQSMPKAKQVERIVIPDPGGFVTGWDLLPDEVLQYVDGKRVIDVEAVHMALATRGLPLDTEVVIVETGSNAPGNHGIRNAFVPVDDDSCYVSMDYKGQELRIAAGLSGEQVWLDAINGGRDIHWTTARAVFGEDADSNHRKTSKTINFGGLFGGTEYALSRSMGCSMEEAKTYLDKYNTGLPALAQWKAFMKKKGRREDLFTYFGRPRRMARYFKDNASWKQQGFGERTSLNTVVQGAGADILRMVLGRVLRHRIKYPKTQGIYSVVSTIHDELNFSVKKNFLRKFVPLMTKLMTVDMMKEWGVVIEVDLSIGRNWGESFPYTFDKESGIFTPEGEKIRVTV